MQPATYGFISSFLIGENSNCLGFITATGAKLGKSGACPHGNLSEMESPASRRHRGLLLLADAAPGAAYAVSGIYERDRRLLEFLEARGIRPGAKLRLLERNYDQTLALSTVAGNVSLGRAAAERVWVSPANNGPAR